MDDMLDDPVRLDFRCRDCGYGVAVAGEPPVCPLCRSNAWTPVPTRFPQRIGGRADASTMPAADDDVVL